MILRLDEDVDRITILDLHPGELYSFTVIAFNQEGNSLQSMEYSIRTREEGMQILLSLFYFQIIPAPSP